MRLLALSTAVLAVFAAVGARRPAVLIDRIRPYLTSTDDSVRRPLFDAPPLRAAGIAWSAAEFRTRRLGAVVAGAVIGLLVADAGAVAGGGWLTVAGGVAGLLGMRSYVAHRAERRQNQIRSELPLVIDLMALYVLAGESVAVVVERIARTTTGEIAREFQLVLDAHARGFELSEVMQSLSGQSDPELGRLFMFLANAHQSGGRLAEALVALSRDLRAQEERRLATEGGKRAVAVYAPILALMIPISVVFLMFPTITGLSTLSAGP